MFHVEWGFMNYSVSASYLSFLAYFSAGLAFLFAFMYVYVRLTPYKEFELICAGNRTAAVALSGNVLGYTVVLYAAIAHSVAWMDMAVWAFIGLGSQYVAYRVTQRFFVRDWSAQIAADNLAAGIFSGALSLAVGLLNAASMSY
jgi:putative membrane protein